MYTERHFSMPYPLPKLDMAAVPYFSGCAKENFGLIIFCEIELLHHELHSGASCKQWFQSDLLVSRMEYLDSVSSTNRWWTTSQCTRTIAPNQGTYHPR
eukprot:XP_019075147.1 PREDICTED: aminopeptidase M1-like isoform X1 [Vitis vinifera]